MIRHAESMSNIDSSYVAEEASQIPLSPNGILQAQALADNWKYDMPSRVITSSYKRAIQTSFPLQLKFPFAKRSHAFVQEWTFLSPRKFAGSNRNSRSSYVRDFIERNDIHYSDGDGAESLCGLRCRVAAMFTYLETKDYKHIVILSHRLFMSAVREYLSGNYAKDVKEFFKADRANPIDNTGVLEFEVTRCHRTKEAYIAEVDRVLNTTIAVDLTMTADQAIDEICKSDIMDERFNVLTNFNTTKVGGTFEGLFNRTDGK